MAILRNFQFQRKYFISIPKLNSAAKYNFNRKRKQKFIINFKYQKRKDIN